MSVRLSIVSGRLDAGRAPRELGVLARAACLARGLERHRRRAV